jgi:hypothetical protein
VPSGRNELVKISGPTRVILMYCRGGYEKIDYITESHGFSIGLNL